MYAGSSTQIDKSNSEHPSESRQHEGTARKIWCRGDRPKDKWIPVIFK